MCAVILYSLAVLSLEFFLALALVAFGHVKALAFVLAGVVGAKAHRNLALSPRIATRTEALEVADHIATPAAVATRRLCTLVDVHFAAIAFKSIWAHALE